MSTRGHKRQKSLKRTQACLTQPETAESAQEFIKRVEERRPLTTLQTLKDRAGARGYRLRVFRGKGTTWEYTIEGLRGQVVRYPWGSSDDFEMLLLTAELTINGLPG